ncbi:hypothetical protein [Spirosoma utsteinense]|uniref:Secreted protein n=1 Tax=Spirosoma utsteinense TaxID=2585773 RepID=A0ABR6W9C5_9BACT|nr:hypothetical protein [Spirosoma utsteinense]MBC3788517.1 hypothetical protein [Spirosoma utsteinense]MBC3793169.1 hypothetical protein [Spirosoma utsteinense]
MRTEMRERGLGWLLLGACIVCVSLNSAKAAGPDQSMPREKTSTDSPTKSETNKRAKSTVLVRNTSNKTGTTASTAAVKTEAPAEKKTISRCWKRLMGMAREIRHAHTKNK